MITGQILLYHYNSLSNSKENDKRNDFSLKTVQVETSEQFRESITDSMDHIRPGQGYALVKWSGRMFICEKDLNQPSIPYVRHEIKYHPLNHVFTC